MAARRVASKTALRVTAWASAVVAVLGSGAVLGWLPKPEPAVALEPRPRRVVVVKRRIVRRVIVEERAAPVASTPTVTYVRAPSSTASSPPAATSTGGS